MAHHELGSCCVPPDTDGFGNDPENHLVDDQRISKDHSQVRSRGGTSREARPVIERLAFQLQRTIGNRETAGLLTSRTSLASPSRLLRQPTVQPAPIVRRLANSSKEPTASFSPPQPNASIQQTPEAPIVVNGVTLTDDASEMRKTLEEYVGSKSIDAMTSLVGLFEHQWYEANQLKMHNYGAERVERVRQTIRSCRDQILSDGRKYAEQFSLAATTRAETMLADSEKMLRDQAGRYGFDLSLPAFNSAGASQDSSGGVPAPEKLAADGQNKEAVKATRDAAIRLREAQRKCRALYTTRVKALSKTPNDPMFADVIDPEEQAWKDSKVAFHKIRSEVLAAHPMLTVYMSGSDSGAALDKFIDSPIESSGQSFAGELKERLDNIVTVRGSIGTRFDPLDNPFVVLTTKQTKGTAKWEGAFVDKEIEKHNQKKADQQILWMAVGFGLGLLSLAAPPLGATAVAVAATATAGFSAWSAYSSLEDYNVAKAAGNTDLDKAKSLSEEDPSLFWLALDLIGAGLDIKAAGTAFKTLAKEINAVRQSKDVRKTLELLAKCPESVRPSVAKHTLQTLTNDELDMFLRESKVEFRQGYLREVGRLVAHHPEKAYFEAFAHLQESGQIVPLTEEAIRAHYGHAKSLSPLYPNRAEEMIKGPHMQWDGFFSLRNKKIFLKPGKTDEIALVAIHEVSHRMVDDGKAMVGASAQLKGKMISPGTPGGDEFIAFRANRDLAVELKRAGRSTPYIEYHAGRSDQEILASLRNYPNVDSKDFDKLNQVFGAEAKIKKEIIRHIPQLVEETVEMVPPTLRDVEPPTVRDPEPPTLRDPRRE
jgi:hypothetical protein